MVSGFKFVYSPRYNINLGGHVFPAIKYDLVKNFLENQLNLKESDFINPEPASQDTICLVHAPDYFHKLKNNLLTNAELLRLEIPLTEDVFQASLICVEGSYIAANMALKHGFGAHIGGGFHHAFSDHGEGFCVFNDLAVTVKKLQRENLIKKACIIDCDLHQGNGTASIFREDNSVFTFSIHQENNYPFYKPPSTLDIGLIDGVGDDVYLNRIKKHVPGILKKFKPDFIMYQAGADPYEKDQLGALKLTKDGLKERDRIIFNQAKEKDIPITVALGGGYAFDVNDTVRIHCNTILEGLKIVRLRQNSTVNQTKR